MQSAELKDGRTNLRTILVGAGVREDESSNAECIMQSAELKDGRTNLRRNLVGAGVREDESSNA